jgi:hypothetical protein
MNGLKEYLVPYIISNMLFLLCMMAAIKKPIWARLFLAVVFLWAACVNTRTALLHPEVYLEYARLTPVPFYRAFINGYFSQHIRPIIFFIATGEFLIFVGLLLANRFVKMACWGGILFGLAISPLSVGSAFPATLLMALSFWILYNNKNRHTIILNWCQYDQVNPYIS